jgi:transcription initiation factor IIE alpha subunit
MLKTESAPSTGTSAQRENHTLTVAPVDLQTMNTQQTVVLLVRLVMRAFYEQDHIVIVDALLKWAPITDVDLAQRLNLQPKQVKQILVALRSEYLVHSSIESVKKSSRQTLEIATWSIDYKLFIDTVNFRLHHLRKELKNKELTVDTFVCPNCSYQFDSYEISSELTHGDAIICSKCGVGELEFVSLNGNSSDTVGLEAKLDKDLHRIIVLLKQAENYVIPLSTRTNVYTIVTPAEAQRKKIEDSHAVRLMESMGAHAHQSTSSSVGALGGSGTGQSGVGARHSLLGNSSVSVIFETEESSDKASDENMKKNLKRTQDKKKESIPYFLQRQQSTDDSIIQSIGVSVREIGSGVNIDEDNISPQFSKKPHFEVNPVTYAELQNMFAENREKATIEESTDQNTEMEIPQQVGDIVFVNVGGVPMNINEITEQDIERMSTEEYVVYTEKLGVNPEDFEYM